jgi:hypothetical protein
MFSLVSLYKVTVRNTGHDICINAYRKEGEEWEDDTWDRTFSFYGYAVHPSVFEMEEGGYFSRKDSDMTEILSIEKIDTLPEGEEIHYGYDNTYSDIIGNITRRYRWTRPLFYPRYYFFGKYGGFKYDLKRFGTFLLTPYRNLRFRIKYGTW